MVSASIIESTCHRDPSPGEEGVFFLMLLLSAERESASLARVGDHETHPLLEETRFDSEQSLFQFPAIDSDQ